ncbi:hypothetical protein PybrP1_001949 [[Pythium] brassicae (nom. inval.)]|nr:hypothetical protein PybrP1_001949 [[Pythium] brassicae (nom. inval.)]
MRQQISAFRHTTIKETRRACAPIKSTLPARLPDEKTAPPRHCAVPTFLPGGPKDFDQIRAVPALLPGGPTIDNEHRAVSAILSGGPMTVPQHRAEPALLPGGPTSIPRQWAHLERLAGAATSAVDTIALPELGHGGQSAPVSRSWSGRSPPLLTCCDLEQTTRSATPAPRTTTRTSTTATEHALSTRTHGDFLPASTLLAPSNLPTRERKQNHRSQRMGASVRTSLWTTILRTPLDVELHSRGLVLPAATPLTDGRSRSLNPTLKATMSEFVRRTHISLPRLAELVRGQTADDYRPNKSILLADLARACRGYRHLDRLLKIAHEGVSVKLAAPLPRQSGPPRNRGSARERLNLLRKNIRAEQDANRSIVVDLDILRFPFGVVDKPGGNPTASGRTIHDLSYPEGESVNDITDSDSFKRPEYRHCDAVVGETLMKEASRPGEGVLLHAGDVNSTFRNINIHSDSVHLFAGVIPEDNALVIDLSATMSSTP